MKSIVKFVYGLKTKLRVLALRLLKPLFDELYLNTHKLYGSKERLHLSAKAKMTNTLFNTCSGSIHIHDCVFTGHNVSILTGTHDYRLTDEKRMHEIRETFDSTDFEIVKNTDITAEVIAALDEISDDKQSRIQKGTGPIIRRSFETFAGVRGTPVYESFQDGSLRYYRYLLRK